MRTVRRSCCLTALLVAACGTGGGNGVDPAVVDASSASDGSVLSIPDGSTSGADGSTSGSDCSDGALKQIFVLTDDRTAAATGAHLFRFDPAALTYTKIGKLNCGLLVGKVPHSMAVDRSGTAFVSMSDGDLYRVDTTTAACTPTGIALRQLETADYGMAFATVGASKQEKLYITATGGWRAPTYRRLETIDPATLKVALIGNLSAPTPANQELAGTGDGRLFAMTLDVRNIRNVIVSVDQLDPTTAATTASKVVPLQAKGGFAFAQWGGNFWMFTEAPDKSARVVEYDYTAGVVKQTVDRTLGVPGTILGAGTSTCAPFAPDR